MISVFLCFTIFIQISISVTAAYIPNSSKNEEITKRYLTPESDPNIANVYTYDQDKLINVMSKSTSYNVKYNVSNQVDSVYVGDSLFVQYEYNDKDMISLLKYGNEQTVRKTFDEMDRTQRVFFDNDLAYEYDYTNDGEVGLEKDYIASRVTVYGNEYEIRTMNMSKQLFSIDELSPNTHIFSILNSDEISRTFTEGDDKTVIDFKAKNGKKCSISTSYDIYGRKIETSISSEDMNINSYYTYCDIISDCVESYKTIIETLNKKEEHLWQFEYDSNYNILKKSYSQNGSPAKVINQYVYDDCDQLVEAINFDEHSTMGYDNSGNILSKQKGDSTTEYLYSTNWGDQLVAYDSKPIVYDGIGNPVFYDGNSYSWAAGRYLSSYQNDRFNIDYTYDELGHRTSKVINRGNTTIAYEYFWLGDTLIGMTVADTSDNSIETVYFIYDLNGEIYGFIKNGTDIYAYEKNKTGDIIAIYNNGKIIAQYSYDDYGNIVSISESDETIRFYNPFYYRSYFLDRETNMYYLLSRYYIPEWGRFLNADEYIANGSEYFSTNMYAYCSNNPINYSDDYGYWDKDDHKEWTWNTGNNCGFTSSISEAVGKASRSVDVLMSTNPLRAPLSWQTNQRYHFDRRNYCNNISNGEDTRLYYYKIYFQNAVDAKNRGDLTAAYDWFGKGLHFIQDVSAHGNMGINLPIARHGEGYDDPTYDWTDSNRISIHKLPYNYQLEGCPTGYGERYQEMIVGTAAAFIAFNLA